MEHMIQDWTIFKSMKKTSKKILAVLVSLIMLLTFTGCSGNKKDEVVFTEDTFSEADDGWYVLHSDMTFEPLFKPTLSTNSSLSMSYANQTQVSFRTLITDQIPTLSSGDMLVVKSETTPSKYTGLFSFDFLGYTCGFSVAKVDLNGNYSFSTADPPTEGSDAYSYFNGLTAADSVITSIGGKTISDDLLNTSKSIKDLEKGGKYEVVWYEGTRVKNAEVAADCMQFISNFNNVEVFNDIKYTVDEYAIMELSDTIENGYWYISDVGLFLLDR